MVGSANSPSGVATAMAQNCQIGAAYLAIKFTGDAPGIAAVPATLNVDNLQVDIFVDWRGSSYQICNGPAKVLARGIDPTQSEDVLINVKTLTAQYGLVFDFPCPVNLMGDDKINIRVTHTAAVTTAANTTWTIECGFIEQQGVMIGIPEFKIYNPQQSESNPVFSVGDDIESIVLISPYVTPNDPVTSVDVTGQGFKTTFSAMAIASLQGNTYDKLPSDQSVLLYRDREHLLDGCKISVNRNTSVAGYVAIVTTRIRITNDSIAHAGISAAKIEARNDAKVENLQYK